MFETVEDFIEIEWDVPKPAKPIRFNNRTNVWYKKLKSMKQFPGRTARIVKNVESYKKAITLRTNIRRSLNTHDPYERWTLASGKEDDGTWGIWATFEGIMSEDEYQAAQLERAKRSEKALAQRRRKELIAQTTLARSSLSGALRPPRVD
jgi:hypothetical protein